MAEIRAFAAYRPAKGLEDQIAALPYDVYSREEAKRVVSLNPLSFLAIDRAETQFPDSVGTYDDCVYEKQRRCSATRSRRADSFRTMCLVIICMSRQ